MTSTRRRARRLAALTLAPVLALGASAGAASGASIDVRTISFETSGLTRVWGSITSPTSKTMRIAARLDDVCAAAGEDDGYGAHLTVVVRFVGGSTRSLTFRDERGCGAAPLPIRRYRTFDRRISSIAIVLLEARRKGSRPDVADARGGTILRRRIPKG